MNQFAIVVLNYNDYETTIHCVDSMVALGIPQNIVVVDNRSSNDSYEILCRQYGDIENVTVVQSEKNGGYSYGNNFGFRYCIEHFASKAVVVLNPDIEIAYAEFLDHLYEKLMADDKLALVSGLMVYNGVFNSSRSGWSIPTSKALLSSRFLLKRTKQDNSYELLREGLLKVDCIAGCCFMIKTSVLQQIGFLDENVFLYNEENLLGIKLREHQMQEALLLQDYYHHNHKNVSAFRSLKHKIFSENACYRSTEYLIGKHYGFGTRVLHHIVHYVNVLYLTMCYVLKRQKRKSTSK